MTVRELYARSQWRVLVAATKLVCEGARARWAVGAYGVVLACGREPSTSESMKGRVFLCFSSFFVCFVGVSSSRQRRFALAGEYGRSWREVDGGEEVKQERSSAARFLFRLCQPPAQHNFQKAVAKPSPVAAALCRRGKLRRPVVAACLGLARSVAVLALDLTRAHVTSPCRRVSVSVSLGHLVWV